MAEPNWQLGENHWGDMAAAKLLLEYLCGKPHHSADVSVAPNDDGVKKMSGGL